MLQLRHPIKSTDFPYSKIHMRAELNLDETDTLKISIEHYDFKQRTKTKAYYSDCHVHGLCRFNNVLPNLITKAIVIW